MVFCDESKTLFNDSKHYLMITTHEMKMMHKAHTHKHTDNDTTTKQKKNTPKHKRHSILAIAIQYDTISLSLIV